MKTSGVHANKISYYLSPDRTKIKEIIRLYGIELKQFRSLYEEFVADHISKISTMLWHLFIFAFISAGLDDFIMFMFIENKCV